MRNTTVLMMCMAVVFVLRMTPNIKIYSVGETEGFLNTYNKNCALSDMWAPYDRGRSGCSSPYSD